tara:strand:+ start:4449 stop:5909 length:1461 start_codon:yes stop_codon:yes gene_type:complete
LLNNKKKIALLIEQGFGARVILQTDILKTLIENGTDPIILTSGPDTITRYLQNTQYPDVPVYSLETEKYDRNSRLPFVRILRMIRLFSLKTQTVSDLFKMEIKDSKAHPNINNKIVTSIVRMGVLLAKLNHRIANTIISLENKIAHVDGNKMFFDEVNPNLLITTSIGTFDHDAYVIREAYKKGIKVVSYILSWDNTTVRGLGTNLSSRIITWSEVMKSELINLHKIDPDIIHVGGVPHYDTYMNNDRLWSRKTIYEKMNIPENKDIILLGTKSPNTYKSNPFVARIICNSIKKNQALQNCVLIVRLHPIYFRNNKTYQSYNENWESLAAEFGPDIIALDYPQTISYDLKYLMADEEIIKLGSILKNSKIVVNMFSTLNIEASIFNIPTINVAFQDKYINTTAYKQARFDIEADKRQTHNLRVTDNDSTVVAYNAIELETELIKTIRNPHQKKLGRSKLVQSECGANLGNAGSNIGNFISLIANNQ